MDWKKACYYGKKVLYYGEDIVPFVGAIREIKKPKDKRSILKIVGFSAYSIWAIAKLTYFGNGIATGEWNPTHYFKNPKENKEIRMDRKEQDLKKENKLEKKTTNYEDILKVIG